MTVMLYQSAVYKINTHKEVATRVCFEEYECKLLPKEIPVRDLAKLFSKMQKVCFKDHNLGNANTKRLIDLFSADTEKTFIVGLSLGFLPNAKNYMDFADAGAATVQKSRLEMLPYQQPWINEVCRAKMRDGSNKSPVFIVMNMIEKYITHYLMKTSKRIDGMYLYVEKKPDHGDPSFLINYYKKYGFVEMEREDDEYFYMKKKLN